jgi:ketosteroid isomerase-like protein
MEERAALLATNNTFYRALEALDLGAMDRLWLHESWVRCIHPGGDAIVGWEQVRRSFQHIFENTGWIRVTATEIVAMPLGEWGLVTCSENISAQAAEGVGLAVAQATNIFTHTASGWRIFHHHASVVPVHVTEPFSGTLQ